MAYTTIDDPTIYFNTKLYTGTGSELAITGVGFQPDWVWSKNRDQSEGHRLFDSVRGATKFIRSNNSDAEGTAAQTLKSFDSDGVTIGTDADMNTSSEKNVLWNWKAGGSSSTNTDGSITSTVSANQTAGFSIVKYTGTGSGATVGHGLNSELGMLIVKKFESGGTTGNWTVWHKGFTSPQHDEVVFLNLTIAEADVSNDTYWNGANPTSSVFSINTNENLNENTYDYIAYCFADVKGYSKVGGSYIGNGSTDGPMIVTGMKPAWIVLKNLNRTEDWLIFDNKRDPDNLVHSRIAANESNADYNGDSNGLDFLSNGFKIRTSNSAWNHSGENFIYMCFAEAPFTTSTGIPTTAR